MENEQIINQHRRSHKALTEAYEGLKQESAQFEHLAQRRQETIDRLNNDIGVANEENTTIRRKMAALEDTYNGLSTKLEQFLDTEKAEEAKVNI